MTIKTTYRSDLIGADEGDGVSMQHEVKKVENQLCLFDGVVEPVTSNLTIDIPLLHVNDVNLTPASSSTTSDSGRKRKRDIVETPQTKLMRQQVDLLNAQVSAFKSIDSSLEKLVKIEEKKVSVMEAQLAINFFNTFKKLKPVNELD